MKGKHALACLIGIAILAAANSGCALRNLREANQRLKESNDRLISENNRLEHELAALQRGREPDDRATAPVSSTDAPQVRPDDPILPIMDAEVTEDAQGIHFRFPERIFFGLGQAKLTRKGQLVLATMADILNNKYPGHVVRVEGHTDDVPVRKVRHIYPSNWELSTARACTVVRYLVERSGVSPRRIYPSGFAYFRPLATGTSSRARNQNRRVEITVLNQRV